MKKPTDDAQLAKLKKACQNHSCKCGTYEKDDTKWSFDAGAHLDTRLCPGNLHSFILFLYRFCQKKLLDIIYREASVSFLALADVL